MSKKHEKSPCCRAVIIRFGKRRRRCVKCKRTWSVWQRKRGRKRLRTSPLLAHRFVSGRLLPVRSGRLNTRNKKSYRLAKSRSLCAERCPWPEIPKAGPLIAVGDALVKCIEGTWHTWYFILVRPVDENTAIALPFYHRKGAETVRGWREAFDAVPENVLERIKALVCDGHRGLVFEAKWRYWLLQRCHFHLIARIQSRRSKWKSSQHYKEGRYLYELVKKVLTESDELKIRKYVNDLEVFSWHTSSPDLKNCLKGFVNHYPEFRTYLAHPELNLPMTNNTAEVLIGLVEEISRRAKGFQKISIFNEWISVVLKTRGRIKCRGIHQQN